MNQPKSRETDLKEKCLIQCAVFFISFGPRDEDALEGLLTEMVRLEDLKPVDDCLWKTMGLPEPPLSCPLTRTTNCTDGILATLTRKLEPSCGSTTPLISPEPIDSARETSVTVAVSLPVTDTNKLTLAPGHEFGQKKKEEKHHCVNDAVCLREPSHSSVLLPGVGRVSRTSSPWKRPCDSSTKSNRKSRRL